jgi:hypothetical protein
MMKKVTIRIIEVSIHRSKKNPRLGHAVALLFPCNHHRYLGLTLYKGEPGTIEYRSQGCRVIKFEDYDVMDKEVCKLCPHEDMWLDDLATETTLEDFADILEAFDD